MRILSLKKQRVHAPTPKIVIKPSRKPKPRLIHTPEQGAEVRRARKRKP